MAIFGVPDITGIDYDSHFALMVPETDTPENRGLPWELMDRELTAREKRNKFACEHIRTDGQPKYG
jgi:hypothetical protein